MSFTYTQTKEIKDIATAENIELWKAMNHIEESHILEIGLCTTNSNILYISDDNKIITTNLQRPKYIYQLTLDNLFPWLDIVFVRYGEMVENNRWIENNMQDIENRDFYKIGVLTGLRKAQPKTLADQIKQDAVDFYFSNPQKLCDMICEEIEKL